MCERILTVFRSKAEFQRELRGLNNSDGVPQVKLQLDVLLTDSLISYNPHNDRLRGKDLN